MFRYMFYQEGLLIGILSGLLSCLAFSCNPPSGWKNLGDAYYFVETTHLNYSMADQNCQSYDAQLAIMYSQDSHDAFISLSKGIYPWIGLTNPYSVACGVSSKIGCRVYRIWSDNTSYVGAPQWQKLFYDLREDAHCGFVNSSAFVNDCRHASCSDLRPSICQLRCGTCGLPTRTSRGQTLYSSNGTQAK